MEGDAGTGQLKPSADSSAPEDDEAERSESPAQRSRLYSRGWVVGVCATLLVLSALVAGGGYLVLRSNQQAQATTRAEVAALRAAKDCVIATQAPDVATISASQQKIIECATGDFGAQATLYSGVLVDAYQADVLAYCRSSERFMGLGDVDSLMGDPLPKIGPGRWIFRAGTDRVGRVYTAK